MWCRYPVDAGRGSRPVGGADQGEPEAPLHEGRRVAVLFLSSGTSTVVALQRGTLLGRVWSGVQDGDRRAGKGLSAARDEQSAHPSCRHRGVGGSRRIGADRARCRQRAAQRGSCRGHVGRGYFVLGGRDGQEFLLGLLLGRSCVLRSSVRFLECSVVAWNVRSSRSIATPQRDSMGCRGGRCRRRWPVDQAVRALGRGCAISQRLRRSGRGAQIGGAEGSHSDGGGREASRVDYR